jgi:hypothetical protein
MLYNRKKSFISHDSVIFLFTRISFLLPPPPPSQIKKTLIIDRYSQLINIQVNQKFKISSISNEIFLRIMFTRICIDYVLFFVKDKQFVNHRFYFKNNFLIIRLYIFIYLNYLSSK